MADITKCVTRGCPLAESCYRKTAKDSVGQSYSRFEGGLECPSYWPSWPEVKYDKRSAKDKP